MFDRYAFRAWLTIAALLLALLAAGALVVMQQGRESLAGARSAAQRESILLASLIRGQLQSGNYQLAQETLRDWGDAEPDVVRLRLVARSDFPLAEYRRDTPADISLTLEAPITYSYAGEARLILTKELRQVADRRDRLIVQLGAAWAVVAAMLLVLTRQQLLHRQQSAKLRTEIAQREVVDQQLRESEERFRSLTEMSSDFYWETDAEHRLTQRTESQREAAEGVFQIASSIGQRRWEIAYVAPDEAGWQKHRAILDAHLPFRNFEISRLRANGVQHHISVSGDPVFDAAGVFKGYRGVGEDITERKTAEEQIRSLAFFDPLTGLPNRRLLVDRLRQAAAAGARSARNGALLFIDLDNFKTLNDTLGHDIGDLLLQQVAQRLVYCVREGDSVARLGGDEFVVMLENLSDNAQEAATQTETVGEKILATLNQPYQLASYAHHSTPSIGVTLFANHQGSTDDLLKRADLAMYQAKAAGRNTLRFFEPEMQAVVTTRAALEAGLREAFVNHQFRLYYQGQFDDRGRLAGVEALLRWQHPQRGLVPPLEFIPLAEDTGLILPIGLWVLEAACEQLNVWAKRPQTAHLTMAVNVSAHQFHQPDFVGQVLAALDCNDVDACKLKLELTESMLVSNVEDIIAKMSALKAKGVGFSLDDFGTGYSSLSYLKRLPLDQLKIDQEFVRDILTDPNDAAIAKTVIALAESFGLAVIAEGVETEAQRDFLARQGCHAYQGYLFGKPMAIAEWDRLLYPLTASPVAD